MQKRRLSSEADYFVKILNKLKKYVGYVCLKILGRFGFVSFIIYCLLAFKRLNQIKYTHSVAFYCAILGKGQETNFHKALIYTCKYEPHCEKTGFVPLLCSISAFVFAA